MILTNAGISDKKAWEDKGYSMPAFEREEMCKKTKAAPYWIHFGAGNIFRAFQANVVQNLLNDGTLDRGLIVAEGFDYEIIDKMNKPHDDLTVLVTLKADGNIEKTVVGSVAESLIVDSANADYDRLKEIFANPSLQMVSFTITEKGYVLSDAKGEYYPGVKSDLENGPKAPVSYIGKVAALLYERYVNGALPVAMVSMDNCSHNGEKLYAAVSVFAKEWEEKGLVEKGFMAYVSDEKQVSFPWTMIDKITPRPDDKIMELLRNDGLEGVDPIITSKNTYVGPFVNAEECEYLVIEDSFPNGIENLKKGGIIFTDRETVTKVERMKVCTCLNPLHTALAVYGCLLGYTSISKEMESPLLRKMVERIGYVEGLPVVTDPGIIKPEDFLNEVINVRIPNPFLPDTPQRIATDTSQKLGIRFGETIKAYVADSTKNVADLKLIPLVLAGWLRYLMAVDDNGNAFTLSPDPLLATVCPAVEGIKLGAVTEVPDAVKELLKREDVFGMDLYKAGLAENVLSYFLELTSGTGAVEKTLTKYVMQ